MNTRKLLPLLAILFMAVACQNSTSKEGYTSLESETEECLDHWFEESGADWTELQSIFENYFASAGISNADDPKNVQYQDILNYWERPNAPFSLFEQKTEAMDIVNSLGLTDEDIFNKKQLNCFTDLYMGHSTEIDTASTYYAFGSILSSAREMPQISPGLIAGAINYSMNPEDLNKSLYQKTIVLMYCFDMALYLPDGTEDPAMFE